LENILHAWSTEQPVETLAWLDALPDHHLRLTLVGGLATRYSSTEPQKSLPFALALPQGENRSRRLADLLGAWARTDASSTLAWIKEHQAEPGVSAASSSAHAAILGTIARDEPATALAEWEKLSDPATRKESIDTITAAWAPSDPGAAVRWATEQHRAQGSLWVSPQRIHAWVTKEPEAALLWAEAETLKLAPGLRDRSLFLSAVAGPPDNRFPRSETADLYSTIKDDALRAETLRRHLAEWRAKDPAAAEAWLKSQTSLSPAESAALSP
jgi:hypothetical protein